MTQWAISGGAGFLGLHLARRLLADGDAVRTLDVVPLDDAELERSVEELRGDIRDPDRVRELVEDADVVVHAAAALPIQASRESIRSVTSPGTENVLRAARDAGVDRVVFISSTAVYGVPEKHRSRKTTRSSASAGTASRRSTPRRSAASPGSRPTIVRPKTFIGPERLGVFEILFDWIREGRRIYILGKGHNRYQLLAVEDLVDAILRAATVPEAGGETFNVGATRFGTVRSTSARSSSTRALIHSQPVPVKLAELLGRGWWKPPVRRRGAACLLPRTGGDRPDRTSSAPTPEPVCDVTAIMRFVSSRDPSCSASLSEALFSGLAPDGGLWCPDRLDPLPQTFLTFAGMAPAEVFRAVSARTSSVTTSRPATSRRWWARASDFPIPLVEIGDDVWALELFHGPTLAFKDVGARFMARLMEHAVEREAGRHPGPGRHLGRHRKRGNAHVPGCARLSRRRLFPGRTHQRAAAQAHHHAGRQRISLAVAGSFDDCQRLVEEAFADPSWLRGWPASANSSTSGDCCRKCSITSWRSPATGGLAKADHRDSQRQLRQPHRRPVCQAARAAGRRFVAATNINDVVPDYLETGVFRPRPSLQTLSNAMDLATLPTSSVSSALRRRSAMRCAPTLAGAHFTDDEVVAAIGGSTRSTATCSIPTLRSARLAIRSLRNQ